MSLLATEILTPRYELAWYPWAVQYFFMIAISYSALMLSLPGLVFRRERFMPLARLALLVAVTCTLVGPVALLADLHQPARFWHFYASPAPWSWMSIGAVLLPPYVVLTILYGYFAWRPALLARGSEGQGWDAKLARLLCLGSWQTPRLAVVVFGALAALSLSRGVRGAILYLLRATDRISHGDFEREVELKRDDELGQIARAVERMRVSLREAMERLRRK